MGVPLDFPGVQLRPEGLGAEAEGALAESLGGPGVTRVTLAPEVLPQAPGVVRVNSRAE